MFTKEIKNEVSANGAEEVSIFAFLYILAHKKQKWTGSLIIICSLIVCRSDPAQRVNNIKRHKT